MAAAALLAAQAVLLLPPPVASCSYAVSGTGAAFVATATARDYDRLRRRSLRQIAFFGFPVRYGNSEAVSASYVIKTSKTTSAAASPASHIRSLGASTATAQKIAVLIDGDNANADMVARLLFELQAYGTIATKRVYGDWMKPTLRVWKNATDASMIIDAMSLLYTQDFDGFCIVSSDSDFTPLAAKLRDAGKLVIGSGAAHSPLAFRAACDHFILFDDLPECDSSDSPVLSSTIAVGDKKRNVRDDTKSLELLRASVRASANEDGWASVYAISQYVLKYAPHVRPSDFGFEKLRELLKAAGLFELKRKDHVYFVRELGGNHSNVQKRSYIGPDRISLAHKERALEHDLDRATREKPMHIKRAIEEPILAGGSRVDDTMLAMLRSCAATCADSEGWASINDIAQYVSHELPTFRSKDYGFPTFRQFLALTGLFDVERRGNTFWSVRLIVPEEADEGGSEEPFAADASPMLEQASAPEETSPDPAGDTASEVQIAVVEFKTPPPIPAPVYRATGKKLRRDSILMELLYAAVELNAGQDGWAEISDIANHLRIKQPDFKPNDYGYAKLRGLLAATERFHIEKRASQFYARPTISPAPLGVVAEDLGRAQTEGSHSASDGVASTWTEIRTDEDNVNGHPVLNNQTMH
eukprot:jgi/Chlat1/7168/Chrsp57S06839